VNEVIRKNAERFGVERFREEFREFVEGIWYSGKESVRRDCPDIGLR